MALEPDREIREPDRETGNLFLGAAGFGVGAIVTTMIFGVLIGIGQGARSPQTASGPSQTAAPGQPAPGGGAETTGQGSTLPESGAR